MSKQIAILTDSCSDVSKEYMSQYGIYSVPMLINCEDGEYKDGVSITADDVYMRLKSGELPKTSTPLGGDIEAMFSRLKEEGYDCVLAIMLSGGLSSTVQTTALIAEDVDMEICVLDSKSASIGYGALVLQAAKWREEGLSFHELCQRVEDLRDRNTVYFSIDTLEYLMKGGRIGKVTALAGTALNIKPILSFDEDGEIYTAAKVRGSKLVMKKLLSLVEEQYHKPEHKGKSYNLIVADGGAPEQRDELEHILKETYPDYQDVFRAKIGAALSTYLGDGLLGAGIQFID